MSRSMGAVGLGVSALALTVLVGRFSGMPQLVTFLPDGMPMAFTSACAFLAIGATLLLLATGRAPRAAWVAPIPGLIGVGTLLLFLVAELLGWSRFVYRPGHPGFFSPTGFSGRTAPSAALCFFLLSCVLMQWTRGVRTPRLAATLASAVICLAGISLASYFLSLRSSADWWRYTAMAVHSALAFGVLGAMVLVWIIRGTPSSAPSSLRTFPFLALATALLSLLAVVVIIGNEQRTRSFEQVQRALEVRAAIERFTAATARSESAMRDYLLSGEPAHLERVRTQRAAIQASLHELRDFAEDRPALSSHVSELRALVSRSEGLQQAAVAARQERGIEAAAGTLEEWRELGLRMRELVNGLIDTEATRLASSREAEAHRQRQMRWTLGLGGALTLGLFGIAFAMLNRARAALQESNDALETRVAERTRDLAFLFDAMPQLVFTATPAGVVDSVNHRWLDYLGVPTLAEALPRVLESVHPDDMPIAAQRWRDMIEQGEPGGGEHRLLRADGSYRWHLWRAFPQRDEGGQLVRWVGTATDITEQKLAAALLETRISERTAEVRRSRERLQSIADNIPLLVAYVDRDLRYQFTNLPYQTWLGLDPEALLGRDFWEIAGDASRATLEPVVARVLDGDRVTLEQATPTLQGERIIRSQYVPHVQDGSVVGFYLVGLDVTDQKQFETTLARARDAALSASKMKSDFMATISHEIRTPMNGIIGMSSLLIDAQKMGPEEKEMVRVIDQSADSLLRIINDILDFSKIEAGKLAIEPAEFDLRDVVKDTAALFAPRATAKRLRLRQEIDARLPTKLHGDAGRIRQVLANLVGNAIKFTDTGEVTVRTAFVAESAAGVDVRVSVTDTGAGITPENQARLFAPFVQVDASAEKRFGGTGLGLAISRQLIGLMGGEIGVSSEPGRGATFWFTLRLPRSGPEEARAAPLRVLAIDDSAADRELTAQVLEEMGLAVESLANAADALTRLRSAAELKTPFDLVLVDQRMPEMGGFEFAREARADPAIASTPIVLLSGVSLEEAAEANTVGFDAFLAKPVGAEQLLRVLRRIAPTRTALTVRAARDHPSPPPPPRTSPLRLLVVDDNEANRLVARLTLTKDGAEVDLAESGRQALEKLAVGTYDAVFMDCQMPGLNGYETTRRIRDGAVPHLDPRLPIIALTAYAMTGDAEKCRQAGMNDYVSKPLRIPELRAALARCGLDLPEAPPASAPPPTATMSPFPSAVDQAYIDEINSLAGDQGRTLWAELLEIYRQAADEHLRNLAGLRQRAAAKELAHAAHRFAGNGASVGAVEVQAAALALEKCAIRSDWGTADRTMARLRTAHDRFLTTADEILASRA